MNSIIPDKTIDTEAIPDKNSFQNIKDKLKNYGYIVIPDVLNKKEILEVKTEHEKWRKTIPEHNKIHNSIDPHGIYKFHEVGHQRHAWLVRINPKVQEIFAKLWNTTTDNLNVSFDGSCYIDKEVKKKDNIWTHTDQAPSKKGLQCYQGFISLTSNKERTLVVYHKSHMIHEKYFKEKGNKSNKNWCKIDLETLQKLDNLKRILQVPAGALVIWDSRTFHQNQYGEPCSEERLVQYVCYLPKTHPKNTKSIQKKRLKYFEERRTTSHWPSPIYVNSKQPRTYGDNTKLINYDSLIPPKLDDLESEIKKLL